MRIAKNKVLLVSLLGAGVISTTLVYGQDWNKNAILDSLQELPANLGVLPPVKAPADNPQTAQKVALGKELFFDKELSGDRSISCSTCHDPGKGFSDGKPLAIGFNGKVLARHSPTVINAAYNTFQFWGGRVSSLEEQARGPITSAGEMNLADETELVRRLNANSHYPQEFQAVFGAPPSLNNVAKAIAAYERTVVTSNSRFDRYVLGDKKALTPQEKNGLVLFIGKARCSLCHSGPNFSDNKFYNLGVAEAHDAGRYAITKDPVDLGAFKTSGLRNVTTHAPYMHDGSLATLADVIDYYDRGGDDAKNKSNLLIKLGLTPEEKRDLAAFLKALTGELTPQQGSRQQTATR
jgi:cytochrome c peroxidase